MHFVYRELERKSIENTKQSTLQQRKKKKKTRKASILCTSCQTLVMLPREAHNAVG